jgi:hypothetical protein
MSWNAPGRAIGVVIQEADGVVHQYARGEDDAGEAIWREARPDAAAIAAGEEPISTAKLLAALTTSLQAPHAPRD